VLYTGDYLALGFTQGAMVMDDVYNAALCFINPYRSDPTAELPYNEVGWHFGYYGCDVYGHGNPLIDFTIKQTYNGTTYTGYTGAVTVGDKTLTFANGILIRVQ